MSTGQIPATARQTQPDGYDDQRNQRSANYPAIFAALEARDDPTHDAHTAVLLKRLMETLHNWPTIGTL